MTNNERLWLFNPFQIENAEDEQIAETFKNLRDSLVYDDKDNPFMIIKDVEIYSNMLVLVGEMVSRYKKKYDDLKLVIDTNYSAIVYEERDKWLREQETKCPAMSYFQSIAKSRLMEESLQLNEFKLYVERFKYTYDSIEQKINVLKKKYDSVKLGIGLN